MTVFATNQHIWDSIYSSGRNNLIYPNDTLVRMTHALFSKDDARTMTLLDYGFGAGGNLQFFRQFGFDVYGLEISEAAKRMALDKTGDRVDPQKLVIMKQDAPLPFDDGFFDAVVSWEAIYYNTAESLDERLHQLHRILKPGGRFIFSMACPDDIMALRSNKISELEHVLDSGIKGQAKAVLVIPENENDIRRLFHAFQIEDIGYYRSEFLGAIKSHSAISGRKI